VEAEGEGCGVRAFSTRKYESCRSGSRATDRAIGARYRVERLADADLLRPDITDEAADILWVLTSFDTFDLLRTGRGDTVDIIAKRLATIAERSLYR
jgi:hypothetical protein